MVQRRASPSHRSLWDRAGMTITQDRCIMHLRFWERYYLRRVSLLYRSRSMSRSGSGVSRGVLPLSGEPPGNAMVAPDKTYGSPLHHVAVAFGKPFPRPGADACIMKTMRYWMLSHSAARCHTATTNRGGDRLGSAANASLCQRFEAIGPGATCRAQIDVVRPCIGGTRCTRSELAAMELIFLLRCSCPCF